MNKNTNLTKLGNTLKETQEALISLLGFDYDVFTSTACFNQGQSDQFSKLTPKESKQVVMKILQLGKFEECEKKCREIYNKLFDEGTKVKQELDTLNKLVDFTIVDVTPIKNKIKELEGQIEVCDKYLQESKNNEKIQYEINLINKELNKIKNLNKCMTCLQNVTEEHKNEMKKEFQKKIDELKVKISGEINVEKYSNYYLTLNTLKVQEQSKLDEIIKQNNKIEEIKKDKQLIEKRFEEIKKELEIYKKLIIAFGKNGIPSYIIENAIPEIEYIVNELLELLDIDMLVKLNMQKELKTGEISDTLDINIIVNGISRQYYNYSGGEKFIIDLSLRIALSIILLRRKGCNNSTLIIDEGLGSLDEINQNKVLKLINIIKEKFNFKRILIITHCSNIQDELENKILIEKVNNYSKIIQSEIEL